MEQKNILPPTLSHHIELTEAIVNELLYAEMTIEE